MIESKYFNAIKAPPAPRLYVTVDNNTHKASKPAWAHKGTQSQTNALCAWPCPRHHKSNQAYLRMIPSSNNHTEHTSRRIINGDKTEIIINLYRIEANMIWPKP